MLNKLSLALDYLDNALEWDYMDKYTQDVLYWNNIIKQKLSQYKENNTSQKLKTNINNLFKLGKFTELDTYLAEVHSIYPNDNDFAIMYAKNKIYLKDYNAARKIIFDILSSFPIKYCIRPFLSRGAIIFDNERLRKSKSSTIVFLPKNARDKEKFKAE